MLTKDWPTDRLYECAKRDGICFQTGPFLVNLQSNIREFVTTWSSCYEELEIREDKPVTHFRIQVMRANGLRRLAKPQAVFRVAGLEPFDPYPLSHAFPMFEWGLNWCIGTMAHKYLLLHSAAVEKDGKAVVMPAQPGSGKSTLCAGMISKGWRLLSDEFGILDMNSGLLQPLPRAAPLKNESIEFIQSFAPEARLGPHFDKTRKGRVAHLFPTGEHLRAQDDQAQPALIVFPRYVPESSLRIKDQPKPVALTRLINNSFNYLISGEKGFEALVNLITQSKCVELQYSNMDEAIEALGDQIGAS